MLVSAVSHEEEQTMSTSTGNPEEDEVVAERMRQMEYEGGLPVQLPARYEGEEGEDSSLDEREAAVREHQEGED